MGVMMKDEFDEIQNKIYRWYTGIKICNRTEFNEADEVNDLSESDVVPLHRFHSQPVDDSVAERSV